MDNQNRVLSPTLYFTGFAQRQGSDEQGPGSSGLPKTEQRDSLGGDFLAEKTELFQPLSQKYGPSRQPSAAGLPKDVGVGLQPKIMGGVGSLRRYFLGTNAPGMVTKTELDDVKRELAELKQSGVLSQLGTAALTTRLGGRGSAARRFPGFR